MTEASAPPAASAKGVKLGKPQSLLVDEINDIKAAEARYAKDNPPHPVMKDGKDVSQPRTFHEGQIEKLLRGSLASKQELILNLCAEAVIEAL